jgi:phenylalanyl-tRNA synthetase beta chain
MRSSLYFGMMQSASRNIRRKTGHGRFFEVGNTHIDHAAAIKTEGLPEERKLVGLCFFGDDESFFTLKGVIERLLSSLHIYNAQFKAVKRSSFQPGRCAELWHDGVKLGELGQLHPDVSAFEDINQAVYMAELGFAALFAARGRAVKFNPLPRFPVVQRDLSVVVDTAREAAELAAIIAGTETEPIISDVRLFDVYRGASLPEGKKSLAFSFSFRSEEHTLTDAEISVAFDAVIAALAKNDAPLRG